VAYYGISHSGSGITCAGEPITVTAYDNLGSTVAPTVGTQLTLSTSPTTGTWVGGNTYSFTGGEMSAIKYLQQTTASTLNINVTDGTYSESSGLDPNITFVNSALKFYNNSTAVGLQNQVAGMGNSAAVLKALRTDTNTGACVAQVIGTKSVKLGYQCVNPVTCINGQNFTVNGVTINSNAASVTPVNISYSGLNLTFDSTGTAPISMNYPDVGKLTLFAQMTLPASGNDPAITWSDTNSFVVKPYTLTIPTTSIQTATGGANPSGTTLSVTPAQSPSPLFASAGTPFQLKVQALNSSGAITPNFGNEIISEKDNMQVKAVSLIYPSGGTLTPLTGAGPSSFLSTTTAGSWLNNTITWNQVGSITLKPELSDGDYLTAGDVYLAPSATGTVGRFYPDHYRLTASALTNSCGSFSYMGQANLNLSYTVQAETLGNLVISNYGGNYGGSSPASPKYVAEDNDGGNGASLNARVTPGMVPTWASGVLQFTTTASSVTTNTADAFSRQTSQAPDGPFTSLQWGLSMNDTFDGRSLINANMNAQATGTCTSTTCTEVALGSPLMMRYGRMRLDDAFGPETVDLPVNFITEYWTGNRFIVNPLDSCTKLDRSAVKYPKGLLSTDANRTVDLTGGTTQGNYITPPVNNYIGFNAGSAGQAFSAPTNSAQGSFIVSVDLTNFPWLRFDWNQDGDYSDVKLPNATFTFGSYRGNDRIIYWRERLQ
jgi:MSHA biogenesis protein MshQ